MYTQQWGNTVHATAMAGAAITNWNAPLTAEQQEVCKKDREKLVNLLRKIIPMQILATIANGAVGWAGIVFYHSEDGPPFSAGLLICAGLFAFSLFGAFNLRQKAQTFNPLSEDIMTGCWVLLFQLPIMFVFIGIFITIILIATSETFSDKCSDTDSWFSMGCTNNPDADIYRKVGVSAIFLIVLNIVTVIASTSLMCMAPRAFATNQMSYQRHVVHGPMTQSVRQDHLVLQPQMMSQQMQGIQGGAAYPPMPMATAPPHPSGLPPPAYNSLFQKQP